MTIETDKAREEISTLNRLRSKFGALSLTEFHKSSVKDKLESQIECVVFLVQKIDQARFAAVVDEASHAVLAACNMILRWEYGADGNPDHWLSRKATAKIYMADFKRKKLIKIN